MIRKTNYADSYFPCDLILINSVLQTAGVLAKTVDDVLVPNEDFDRYHVV